MVDKKVTELNALSAVDSADLMYVVDVSDTTDSAEGSSRRVALSDLRVYEETTAETSAGVTIVDLSYPPGNVLRYGVNTTPGTTDMTTAIQAAIDVIYEQGGGDVYIPAGTYAVTSVSRVWTTVVSVNIRGAGRYATILQKIGATTTPVLDFSAASVKEPNNVLSDFSIVGNAKGHDGLKITLLARFVLQRISIFSCDVALNLLGTQIFSIYDPLFNSNNTGIKTAVNSSIYCNSIHVFGGILNGNTSWALDLTGGRGNNFYGTDFQLNGTTADLTTGVCMIRSTADDEGFGQISFLGNWLESNLGVTFKTEAAGNMELSLRNVDIFGAESGNSMDVGVIKRLTLENVQVPGTGDTVISAATRTVLKGGFIDTYTDNSTTTNIDCNIGGVTAGISTQAVSGNGSIGNIGQSGPFAFLSVASGVPTLGAYDYDATATQPLNMSATHIQIPSYTDTQLNDNTHAVNTGAGKILRSMVFNSTQGIAVFAAGNADGSVWVDGAGTTVNTPV